MEHSYYQNGTLILSKRNSYSSWNGNTHIVDELVPFVLWIRVDDIVYTSASSRERELSSSACHGLSPGALDPHSMTC